MIQIYPNLKQASGRIAEKHTIFVAHQLQELCKEQNCQLRAVFFDLTKAFYTVNREALWALLENYVVR